VRHVQVSVGVVRDHAGMPAYTSAVVNDVTERVVAEAEVEASEERFRSLVHGVSDVISLHDADGTIAYMSPSGLRLLGLPAETHVGELEPFVHPDDIARVTESFEAWVHGDGRPVQYRMRRDDGQWVHCESVGVNLLENPAVAGVVVTTRDISERKKAMDELAYQAVHDCLTGLPNRTLFLDRITQALARRERSGSSLAVLFLDLDNFKFINDSYGHHAGDEVLVTVSRLLQATIRPGDTIARLGGDEFAVVCEDVQDVDAARALAERLGTVLRTAVDVRGHVVHIATSVGIAFAGPDDDVTADDLLRDADVALYRAKDRGRARTEVFDDELRGRALRRVELEEALREAMTANQLAVHYQPQVDVTTGRVTGFEALLRWHHPRLGEVSPSEFVPIAESTGLIRPIGRWVLDRAAAQLAAWRADHPGTTVTVAVNLSALQLAGDDLVDTVQEAISRHRLDPASLCLEITESVVMDDASASVETLRRLKSLGVRLAIDDFGTGYSSLAYLKRLPVDCLKIDRVFVAGLGRDPEDTVIVASVIDLGSRLGLEVVAEGVETESQLRELADLGCTRAQGFLWSAPQAALEAARHIGTTTLQAAGSVGDRRPPVAQAPAPESSVDDVVSTLAHELRTPITVIRGFAETLGELMRDGHVDVLQGALDAITRQTDGMESVIASLSDVRTIDNGSLSLTRERVGLVGTVKCIVDDLRASADGHDLCLSAETDELVSVDVDRLRQILANLLTNAVRHSPAGAPVRIGIESAEDGVAIRVVDCGPGIPPHRLGELFRKFSRLDRVGRGTGLGLYLARSLARAHGGDIRYRRADTGGAEFVLTLPRGPGADRQPPSPPAVEVHRGSPDEPTLAAAFRATRALLGVVCAEHAVGIAIDLIRDLGGRTAPARAAGPYALDIDLSLGEGERLLPVAEPLSVVRERIEQVLPSFLADAEAVLAGLPDGGGLGIDPVTGLSDRLTFEAAAHDTVGLRTVVMLHLTDTLGVAAADRAAKALSRVLRAEVGTGTTTVRWDDGSLAVVTTTDSVEETAALVERLRAAWELTGAHVANLAVGAAGFRRNDELDAVLTKLHAALGRESGAFPPRA
jgi:diguanylate cyclase (GGDEF)-like protein/PAS domain S-box-containing protein